MSFHLCSLVEAYKIVSIILERSIYLRPPILYFKKKYKTHLMQTYEER